jgi:hypothetical protein
MVPNITPPRVPAPRRPKWVYVVACVYLLLLVTILGLPSAAALVNREYGALVGLGVINALILLIGGSLLVIPIGRQWDLPESKKSIILPLIGSALGAAALYGGAALASWEYAFGEENEKVADTVGQILLTGTGVVWLVWLLLFAFLARSVDRLTLGDRMYQILLAGSVAELLVAVPMHLVVRQRAQCCAGMYTALGIGLGVVVMFAAMGPAVFFLFFRRYKQAYAHRRRRISWEAEENADDDVEV